MTTYQEINAAARSTQDDIKVRYTAKTHTSGGRRGGVSRSDDGRLDVKFSAPGAPGTGTNPEQLFAAAYAASFLRAMQDVATRDTLAMPPESWVESTVGIGAIPQGFGLEVELRIALPGLSHREAEALVTQAHEVCPYSNATRGNIAVRLVLVSSHS